MDEDGGAGSILQAVEDRTPTVGDAAPSARRSWGDLAMERRYRLILALAPGEVSALLPLVGAVDPTEAEPRWTLLRGMVAEQEAVLKKLAPMKSLRDRLGVADLREWLCEGQAGSWVREVPPERGWAFLFLFREAGLRAVRGRLGWEQPAPRFEGELRREFLRRFGGDWPELMANLDALTAARGVEQLTDAAVSRDPWSVLGSWLVGRRVVLKGLAVEEAPRSPAENALLPTPPQLLGLSLNLLRVTTIGDLADLDTETFRQARGVGPKRIAEFEEWRTRVLGPAAPVVVETTPEVAPGRLAEPLGPLPGLVRSLLQDLGIDTKGALLKLKPRRLKGRRGVGGLRVAALERLQEDVWRDVLRPEQPEHPVAMRPDFESLSRLGAAVLAAAPERHRRLLESRLLRGDTLAVCAHGEGLSRERARQIVADALSRLRPEFEDEARRLLGQECGETWRFGVLQQSDTENATVPFAELRLPLALTGDGWSLPEEGWLYQGTAGDFIALQKALRRWIRERASLDDGELDGAPGGRVVAAELLIGRFGFDRDADGIWRNAQRENALATPTSKQRLVEMLRLAGEPRHQQDLARALSEEDGQVAATAAELASWCRFVEGLLMRAPAVYRCGQGTFVHRDFLPVSEDRLLEFTDWCVDVMEGGRGVFDTRRLGNELVRAGAGEREMNPWLLKDALRRRREVLVLRKFQVAYAATFAGAFDRLVGVPRER